MKKIPALSASLMTAGLLAAVPLTAQAVECSELNFTGEVAERFPNASEYCLDVAERDGEPYAHFVGEIERVRGSTVYMKFKRPDGDYGPSVAITPPSDFRAKIDGRSYSVRSLTRGQELDVWVPEEDWEIAQEETAEDLVHFGQPGPNLAYLASKACQYYDLIDHPFSYTLCICAPLF